ncbi:MAG: hypothetical protein KDD44_08250, partial [Bdellovibrionales bacterium]|nr:hypothetical protein [Bdellovibrionales bacterium]
MPNARKNYLRYLLAGIAALLLIALPGSVRAAQTVPPLTGVWNGYFNHFVVVECTSLAEEAVSYQLVLKSNGGGQIATLPFVLNPHSTVHLPLNGFPTQDAYGTYTIEAAPGATNASIACHTAFYRFSAAGSPAPVEYAFSIPAGLEQAGPTAGIFNSMDPEAEGAAVLNWLSIVNLDAVPFTGSVASFDQNGNAAPDSSYPQITLAPGERLDLPLGHHVGQQIGLYTIQPSSITAPYSAFITRFRQDSASTFSFAFPLTALGGSCSPEPVLASTFGPATNWGEIANPTSETVNARIEVRNSSGTLLHQELRVLAPRSQYHLYLNQFLGADNVGSLRVSCVSPPGGARLL